MVYIRQTDSFMTLRRQAVQTFNKKKQKVERPKGWRKTTKQEDKDILQTFHEVRSPGHGVVSRTVRNMLPAKVRRKICKRTVRTCGAGC